MEVQQICPMCHRLGCIQHPHFIRTFPVDGGKYFNFPCERGCSYQMHQSPEEIEQVLLQPLQRFQNPNCPCYGGRPPQSMVSKFDGFSETSKLKVKTMAVLGVIVLVLLVFGAK